MPLFVCSNRRCRSIDNTAVSPASWGHIYGDGLPLCTECACRAGWHQLFAQVHYDPDAEPGSAANPNRLWVDGEWRNELPRRTGHWTSVDGKNTWVWDDEN